MASRDRPDSEPPTEDRRRALREKAFVLAQVTTPAGKERLGAITDASAEGVALLLHTDVAVGDAISIAIELEEGSWLTVEGEVVRRETVSPDGPWRLKVGVDIDPPSEELEAAAPAIRAKNEARFGRRER